MEIGVLIILYMYSTRLPDITLMRSLQWTTKQHQGNSYDVNMAD
jgi:hypothetical protein